LATPAKAKLRPLSLQHWFEKVASNWEKSEKKNETVRFFCTLLRVSGLVGLSLPVPNFDEQNFAELMPPVLMTVSTPFTSVMGLLESAYSENPEVVTHSRPSHSFISCFLQFWGSLSSKSKKENCIQLRVTGWPVSRLTNLNWSLTS